MKNRKKWKGVILNPTPHRFTYTRMHPPITPFPFPGAMAKNNFGAKLEELR